MCVHTHTPSLPSLMQGEMLSTENAPVSTSLLPALSKWVSQNSTVTVGQLTLTANCIDSTPETKSALDMYCVPPTSGVLPSKDDNYLSAFVAFLVLFIITVAIAGVLSIFLIVLLCNRHKPGSNIFCIGYVLFIAPERFVLFIALDY